MSNKDTQQVMYYIPWGFELMPLSEATVAAVERIDPAIGYVELAEYRPVRPGDLQSLPFEIRASGFADAVSWILNKHDVYLCNRGGGLIDEPHRVVEPDAELQRVVMGWLERKHLGDDPRDTISYVPTGATMRVYPLHIRRFQRRD